jgi:hypothetical protein
MRLCCLWDPQLQMLCWQRLRFVGWKQTLLLLIESRAICSRFGEQNVTYQGCLLWLLLQMHVGSVL